MSGALTLLFLLTVTLLIVRVASVALRLTGLPQPVARFQATSALTGTGFTTSEAEGTMHHPARRRILTLLMFAGHLGLVSLTSTVILAMTSTQDSTGAIVQIVAMLAAVGVICALAVSDTVDRVMCDLIGRLLRKLEWITPLPYEILFENTDGYQLGEHVVSSQKEVSGNLHLISFNGQILGPELPLQLAPGDRVVFYARPAEHLAWASDTKTDLQGSGQ